MTIPPSAYGDRLAPVIDLRPKCWRCKRTLFGYAAQPWSIICRRCSALNAAGDETLVAGSSAA